MWVATPRDSDLVGTSTYKERRIVHRVANDGDAAAFEIRRQIRRCKQGDGLTDRTQRVEAADGQQPGITRAETRDANQHAASFATARRCPGEDTAACAI
jgi:hypothetical protein